MQTKSPRASRPSGSSGRLTGERPQQGVTPDSLLALHDAGYRAVMERLGEGSLLDVGCGEGFESVRFMGDGRSVFGVDYSEEATTSAAGNFGSEGLRVARMDALKLGLAGGRFEWAVSSHIIEHFEVPETHVSEIARVLSPSGTAFFLTPNAPADFENPFHVHLFGPDELSALLCRYFEEVSVLGLDAIASVKQDLAARRAKASKLLRFDVFDIRHRVPRNWYVAAYTRLLPLAYRLLARKDAGGGTGISGEDFFVTSAIDETTLVLFAVARRPRSRDRTGAAAVGRGEGSS